MVIPDQFSFIKWLKQDIVALVDNKYGKKLVLKTSPNAKYLEEFSKLVESSTRHLKEVMPRIFSTEGFIYHEYISGQLSGDTTSLFGVNEDAFAPIDPKILAHCLFELQVLSAAPVFLVPKPLVPVAGMTKNNFVLEERQSSWYLNNLSETKEALEKHLGQGFFEKAQIFLGNHGRSVDACSKVLVDGDLHPENMMIKCLIAGEAKDFMLSDWDLLHFNNPGYDLADLYVWGWRNQDWREKLINEFTGLYLGNKEELAVCLKFCQAYLASQMVKHATLMLNTNLSEDAKLNANGLLESSKSLLKEIVL